MGREDKTPTSHLGCQYEAHREAESRAADHAEVSQHQHSLEAGGDCPCAAASGHVSVLIPRAWIPLIKTTCLKVSVASMRLAPPLCTEHRPAGGIRSPGISVPSGNGPQRRPAGAGRRPARAPAAAPILITCPRIPGLMTLKQNNQI